MSVIHSISRESSSRIGTLARLWVVTRLLNLAARLEAGLRDSAKFMRKVVMPPLEQRMEVLQDQLYPARDLGVLNPYERVEE